MDIGRTIEQMKKEPGFTDNVGMVLVHNGVVRGWSRKDRSSVEYIDVSADTEKMNALREHWRRIQLRR